MGGAGGAEGEEETDQAAAPSTGKAEGIGRDSRAGRRLEERASSSRRRAGAGGRAGRRGETHTGEARRWQGRAERRDTRR